MKEKNGNVDVAPFRNRFKEKSSHCKVSLWPSFVQFNALLLVSLFFQEFVNGVVTPFSYMPMKFNCSWINELIATGRWRGGRQKNQIPNSKSYSFLTENIHQHFNYQWQKSKWMWIMTKIQNPTLKNNLYFYYFIEKGTKFICLIEAMRT